MDPIWTRLVAGAGVVSLSVSAVATDLRIHLNGKQALKRVRAVYKCDAQGVKMGLPSGTFTVEYVAGAGNTLAIVPVNKNSMIFARVIAGSGAKFAAGVFTWWEAGEKGTTFSLDSPTGKTSSSCHTEQVLGGLDKWAAPDPLPQQP
jgi:membrane-bound inhibitor of C-type lysozyme